MLALRPFATDGFTATNANSTCTFKRRRHSISTSTLLLPKPTDAMTDSSPRKPLMRLPLAPSSVLRRARVPMPTLFSPTHAKKLAADGPRRHSFLTPPTSRSTSAPMTAVAPSAVSPAKVLCASHPHTVRSPVHSPFSTSLADCKPTPTSSTPTQASSPRELPILRYAYTARDVRVAVGASWRMQRYEPKNIRLYTGAVPKLHLFAKSDPSTDSDTVVFELPSDTTCTVQSGHNGLKLKSHTNSQLRLRIRFATAADAAIWHRVIRDALVHANSLATVDEVRCLSRDCMSRVVVVRDRMTSQEHVVKVLQNVRVDDGSCDEVATIKRLFPVLHQWKSLAFLADYRVVETQHDVHVVMPMHPGKTLLQFLSDRPKPHTLSETEAKMTTWRICEELHALHENHIVHCDLKLENVLVTADATDARVIDFGGAYDTTRPNNQPQTAKLIGTPGYIAPERITNVDDAPTAAADLFSLGVLLYQVLVGQHPYQLRRRLSIQDSLALSWDYMQRQLALRHVSTEAQELIRQLVAKDPRERITLDQLFQHKWFTTA